MLVNFDWREVGDIELADYDDILEHVMTVCPVDQIIKALRKGVGQRGDLAEGIAWKLVGERRDIVTKAPGKENSGTLEELKSTASDMLDILQDMIDDIIRYESGEI